MGNGGAKFNLFSGVGLFPLKAKIKKEARKT